MTKNKKNPPVQKLSPENYIRQKARNLPIYECWTNSDWKESGSANVLVSRVHTNENITYAMCLVDLHCLGVKDSIYNFNLPINEFRKFIDKVKQDIDLVKIDYVLAHNIILAGIEYAEELGFKPNRSFTAVSQYLLDEDTDEIELMKIPCGRNGKPLFIKTDFMSNLEAQRIMAQLDKSVGKGNYNVILNELGNEYDFDEDFDDESNLIDEYNLITYDEKITLFKKMTFNGLDEVSAEDMKKIIALTNSIFLMDLCDKKEVADLCERWSSDINMEIDDDIYTWESLGLESERSISEKESLQFNELEELIDKQSKKTEKKLEILRKKWGDIPYLKSLELNYLEMTNQKLYKSKLIEYGPKLLGFPIFMMDLYNHMVVNAIENMDLADIINIDDVFVGRESISYKEMVIYMTNKLLGLQIRDNKNELEAMYTLLDDLDIGDSGLDMLKALIEFIRIHSLIKHYK